MPQPLLHEEFNRLPLDERLSWYCPPEHWSVRNSVLTIEPEAGTDYWQKTHYGFAADQGPFLNLEIEGDFLLSTQVKFSPVNQYDQAGLMVRLSPEHWIKTCVEYEPDGPSWLGVVVTNFGYSDWSTQPFEGQSNQLGLRIVNHGSDFLIQYSDVQPDRKWRQLRIAHLFNPEQKPLQAGLFACSPKGKGFKAEFQFLLVEKE